MGHLGLHAFLLLLATLFGVDILQIGVKGQPLEMDNNIANSAVVDSSENRDVRASTAEIYNMLHFLGDGKKRFSGQIPMAWGGGKRSWGAKPHKGHYLLQGKFRTSSSRNKRNSREGTQMTPEEENDFVSKLQANKRFWGPVPMTWAGSGKRYSVFRGTPMGWLSGGGKRFNDDKNLPIAWTSGSSDLANDFYTSLLEKSQRFTQGKRSGNSLESAHLTHPVLPGETLEEFQKRMDLSGFKHPMFKKDLSGFKHPMFKKNAAKSN